jgi:hypothetical protein
MPIIETRRQLLITGGNTTHGVQSEMLNGFAHRPISLCKCSLNHCVLPPDVMRNWRRDSE